MIMRRRKDKMRDATNMIYFTTAGPRTSWKIEHETRDRTKVRIRIDGNQEGLLKNLIENHDKILDLHGVKITGAKTSTGLLVHCRVVAE